MNWVLPSDTTVTLLPEIRLLKDILIDKIWMLNIQGAFFSHEDKTQTISPPPIYAYAFIYYFP